MQYFSAFALIISLVSLFFSLRHNRFNNRFKLYEARLEILSTISENLLIHSRCTAVHRDLLAESKRIGDPDIDLMAHEIGELIDSLSARLEKLFQSSSSLRDGDLLSGFRDLLPDIRRMRDQLTELHEMIVGTYARAKKAAPLPPKA